MAIDNKTRRLQVTLPDSTVKMIDEILEEAGIKSRSAFLNEAAQQYASRLKRAHLKQLLRAGYKAHAQRDADIEREWSNASNEV